MSTIADWESSYGFFKSEMLMRSRLKSHPPVCTSIEERSPDVCKYLFRVKWSQAVWARYAAHGQYKIGDLL